MGSAIDFVVRCHAFGFSKFATGSYSGERASLVYFFHESGNQRPKVPCNPYIACLFLFRVCLGFFTTGKLMSHLWKHIAPNPQLAPALILQHHTFSLIFMAHRHFECRCRWHPTCRCSFNIHPPPTSYLTSIVDKSHGFQNQPTTYLQGSIVIRVRV